MDSLDLNLLLPGIGKLRLESALATEQTLTLRLTSLSPTADCPLCAGASSAIHSRYGRTLADLPWAELQVQLQVQLRKFFCHNRACPRRVFAERLSGVAAPFARRTLRIQDAQRQLGLAHGAEAGARTAAQQHLPLSPDTLLRLIRRTPLASPSTPRVLGVDDWALRTGQSYGTLLVDLETHVPIELLADRSADTLAAWLQAHPGVEIISRDRAGAYADGAARGAPAAIQVADRFHLLQNLRDALQRMLDRHQNSLRQVMQPATDGSSDQASGTVAPSVVVDAQGTAALTAGERSPDALAASGAAQDNPEQAPLALTRAEQAKQLSRARRETRYQAVQHLAAAGLSQRAIGAQLQLGRRTVKRFLAADRFPERAQSSPRASKLDPYTPFLAQQLAVGQDNALQLWREICAQGYRGSRTLVSMWVARHRQLCPPAAAPGPTAAKRRGRPPAVLDTPRAEAIRPLSARQAAWLLLRRPADLDAEDQGLLDRLRQVCGEAQVAYDLAQDFAQMVRTRALPLFESWLERARACGIAELKGFVAGLQRDKGAVVAALSLPYSNGPVEGHITRLKFIKRSMYGRANLDLLRHRVLVA